MSINDSISEFNFYLRSSIEVPFTELKWCNFQIAGKIMNEIKVSPLYHFSWKEIDYTDTASYFGLMYYLFKFNYVIADVFHVSTKLFVFFY